MIGKDKSIIRLNPDPEGFGETPDKLEAEDFSSEVPVQHTHSNYEDDEIGLYVGLWDTETMVEAGGPYACDEFMWLLEGECQIKNNRTGRFFSGTWAAQAFESGQRPFPYYEFAYVQDGSITLTDAEGAAQARLKAADAEATAIKQISQSIGTTSQTTNYLITSRYIDSLRDMTKSQNSKVIFMPTETSNVLSTVGSIKEMLSATGDDDDKDALPKPPDRRELDR